MSEILSNIVIEQIEATFQPEVNNLNITPNAISLNIYTSAAPIAAGSNTDVQFNLNGALFGSNAFTFNNSTNTVTVDNFVASDSANLGDASNVTILGGTNGYFLQTDGTGNLTWSAAGNGGGGNGTPGGSNTQIQYNDSGVFGGNVGFTFNETNGNVNIPGNLIVAGNISGTFTGNASNANYANFAGNVVNSSQPNITSVGTLTSLSVTGTMSAGNVTGNGAGLSSLTGANVTGFVPNAVHANTATTAGTVTTAAQPNITSVGTLTSLGVSGNITAANITANTGIFAGNGSGLTSITGANVSGTVANATYAVSAGSANTAGTVTTNAQPNITSVGTLTSLGVSGNITASNITANTGIFAGNGSGLTNIAGANITGFVANATIANTVRNNAQPNITSLGALTSLTLTSANVNLGQGALANGTRSISVGYFAGTMLGVSSTGNDKIAIGSTTGGNSNRANTIAIGYYAGRDRQGTNAIAIGALAGETSQPNNSIILNATGGVLDGTTANALYIKPIRNATQSNYLYYDATSGEITYDAGTGGGNTAAGSNTQVQFNTANLLDASNNFTFNTSTNVLSVIGNITANNVGGGNTVTANFFIGSGNNLSNIQGANVTGNVSSAATATTAGTVTTAAQPNITSVGTLTNLNTTGSANIGTSGGVTINANTSSITLNGTTVINGDTTINSPGNIIIEPAIIQDFGTTSITSGQVNINVQIQSAIFCTGTATGNYNVNILGNLSGGQSCNLKFTMNNGNTNAYKINQIQVNGSNITGYFKAIYNPTLGYTYVHNIQLINRTGTYYAYVDWQEY